jgi:predicted nucleic acid-binding protein
MKRSTAIKPLGPTPLFVDTWGWLVLADAGDRSHAQAVKERRLRTQPRLLVTTDYILDECFTRLFARCHFEQARQFSDAVLEAAQVGQLTVERITPVRFAAAYRLRLKYRDKPAISFTDLTSFAVMKECGIRDVLTGDAHFAQAGLGFRRVP